MSDTAANPVPAAPRATPAGLPIEIREARAADLPQVLAIYAHHVATGLGSFEEEPPDLDEIKRQRQAARALGLPYLVAITDGRVRAFAYAAPFRPRSAYRNTVENSIYVAPDSLRRGVGLPLLERLIDLCTALGYRQMVAVIGDSGNEASIRMHERAGFSHAGTLRAVGFKLGRWVDSVLMQLSLGEGGRTLPVPCDDGGATPPSAA